MPQFQIIGPDGHPALTKDGATALPGAVAIEGARALILDDGGWSQPGEPDYSDQAARDFCAALGAGFTFACMGRSPTAQNPADMAARAEQAQREADEAKAAAEAQAAQAARQAEEAQAAELRERAEREAMAARIADALLRKRDPAAWQRAKDEAEVNARHDADRFEAERLGLGADVLDGIEELRAAELQVIATRYAKGGA